MAQPRKRRRTKHRGNAAGVVESRGRTGRKPGASERKPSARDEARNKREERLMRPPSWKSAISRAAISAALFVVLLVLLFGQEIGPAIALGGFVLLFYIPLGYYTDLIVYRRRLRKRQAKRA